MKKVVNFIALWLLVLPGLAQQKTRISGTLLNCESSVLELIPQTGNFTAVQVHTYLKPVLQYRYIFNGSRNKRFSRQLYNNTRSCTF